MAKFGTFKFGKAKYGSEIRYIYDRTTTDLINDTEKAYINYWDLNRIEQRMKELNDVLNDNSYTVYIITKTDWIKQISTDNLSNFPLLSQLQRLHDNEESLIDNFYTYPTTPKLPETFENLDISKMNDIEKILYDLHLLVTTMIKNYRYCGTFESGEEYI